MAILNPISTEKPVKELNDTIVPNVDKLYKFGKVWAQTEITVRLAIAYFNWILVHRRKENTAAQRAELAIAPWSWNDHYTYPTLY